MIGEALLRVVSAHTGRPEAFARPPARITGGFWAAIYRFELDQPRSDLRGPLVLRVMPDRGSGARESIVQRLVADQGYPTPRVVFDGFDEGLGGAFMVMELVDGVAPLGGLDFDRGLARLPKTLRRLPHQLSSATARLHGLDQQPIIEALERAGIDISTLGIASRLDEIGRAADESFGDSSRS